jgi:hypothetical protein
MAFSADGIHRLVLKHGYKSIQYIALESSATTAANLNSMPTLKEALAHSNTAAVDRDLGRPAPGCSPAWSCGGWRHGAC